VPTFNYHCRTCDNTHTEFHLKYEEALKPTECTACGAEALKSISTPKIHLDGSDPNFVAAHDRWVKEHETRGNGTRSY